MKTSLFLTAAIVLTGCVNGRMNLGPEESSVGGTGGTVAGGTAAGGKSGQLSSGGAAGTPYPLISVDGLKLLTLTKTGGMSAIQRNPPEWSINFETGALSYVYCTAPLESTTCTDYTDYSRTLTEYELTSAKNTLQLITAPQPYCGADAPVDIMKLGYVDRSISYTDDFYEDCPPSNLANGIAFAHGVMTFDQNIAAMARNPSLPTNYDFITVASDTIETTELTAAYCAIHPQYMRFALPARMSGMDSYFCTRDSTGTWVPTAASFNAFSAAATNDLLTLVANLKLGATNDCDAKRVVPFLTFTTGDVASTTYSDEHGACSWSTSVNPPFVVGLAALYDRLVTLSPTP
jgi:hypothetical protein